MKTCKRCNTEKPLEEFATRLRNKDSRQPYCKECKRSIDKKFYEGSDVRKQTMRENTRRAKERNRRYVWKYLESHPCVECGEGDPRVLDFDHLDRSTKRDTMASLKRSSRSIKTLDEEIAKCRVLCANCHRKHTYDQLGWSTYFTEEEK
jgi:hypothetical protein